ncbi:MAG: right-handed parallel beta-helix repeat-containing protein [bacterium]
MMKWLSLICLFLLAVATQAIPLMLFVAPNGVDNAPGTIEQPLASMEGARNLIQARRAAGIINEGGYQVLLRGGVYRLIRPFVLTTLDSGTVPEPISYLANPGEEVVIMGSIPLANAYLYGPAPDLLPGGMQIGPFDGRLYYRNALLPAEVSIMDQLIQVNNAAFITFGGMNFTGARGTAVSMINCENCLVTNSVVQYNGGAGIAINGGQNVGVLNCDIHDTGAGGVNLISGDRQTLFPAGLFAENNTIRNCSRAFPAPGVYLDGVGNRAVHNLIADFPGPGVVVNGNDMVVDMNDIRNVLQGVLLPGRDWTLRGNRIVNNFIHDMPRSTGISLLDDASGVAIAGNIIARTGTGVFLDGGRDNTIQNNFFVDNPIAVRVAADVDNNAQTWELHSHIGTTSELYRTRYPRLQNLADNDPLLPLGNNISNNLISGGQGIEFLDNTGRYVAANNNPNEINPGFTDRDKDDYRLTPEARERLKGIRQPTQENMGRLK